MRLFTVFIVLCCIVAFALRDRGLKTSVWVLLGLTLLVSAGYYFFQQI